MGRFSSNAGTALEKVLSRMTLVDLGQLINSLQSAINNNDARTESVEAEARRILDVTYNAAGKEIIDRGRLTHNLTHGLDGPDLVRAIDIVKSARNSLIAERRSWLAEKKAEWVAQDHPTLFKEGLFKGHGPGV
ncbi:hypothetical protein ES703_109759 [subsurface metagenome]